jgi:hypothetical protein
MTGQVWLSTNPVRLQKEVLGANCEVTGESGTIDSELPLGFATSAHEIVTLTQRILQLLESRGYLLLLFASLIGSLSLPAHSQQFTELPNTPSFNKKLFIAELSTYTTMNVLDGITTAQSVREGNVEGSFPSGSSYLLGRRPSVVRYAVTMGLLEAGVSLAAYRLQHSKTKWLRVAGHGLMIQGAYGHTDGVIRNIRLLQSH